jgi:hypothetical protein
LFLNVKVVEMPEISRFLGIVIRMFVEVGGQHSLPHFHAYYQECETVYGIDPIHLITGHMPLRQQRLVEAWAELHQEQLREDWERLQSGRKPFPIVPLR